jgi:hypothetical protein
MLERAMSALRLGSGKASSHDDDPREGHRMDTLDFVERHGHPYN